MGDRNNPIKFGPEWLRNLPRERSTGRTSQNSRPGTRSGSQGAGANAGAAGGSGGTHGTQAGASGSDNACASALPSRSSPSPSTSTGANTRNTIKPIPKVQLAKMRYGREEMLALYDRTTEAPDELKNIDVLYQPRAKPPVALNTFEDEMRDNIRGGPSIPMSTERFGIGRGAGRGVVVAEARSRSRMPFVRNPSGPTSGRGSASHSGTVKMPGLVGPDDKAASARPWSASNGGVTYRTGDETDWATNKLYRRRQANNTNWRQTSRDEGDEWRNQEATRSTNRVNLDKWDREWSERPGQDRPQSWNSNRRTWGGDIQNEDNLPEWAVDNAEAGAGTFDSSGAFHGYSNDDSNLPKTQDTPYQLTRSQTHGSFSRSKTVEEGSDEWWASEKAKKLSPKRFESGEPKFQKPSNAGSSEQQTNACKKIDLDALGESSGEDFGKANQKNDLNMTDDQALRLKFSESKTFDALMRSEIDFAESSDERSNFQSVIIAPNNSLRQKHQNIVSNDTTQAHSAGLLHLLHGIPMSSQKGEADSKQPPEEKIVEEIIDMTLEDRTLANITHQVNSGITQMANSNLQMRITSPVMPLMQMNTAQQIQTSLPIQNVGIPNQALNSSLGLPIGQGSNGMPMPLQGIQNSGLSSMGTMQSRAVMGGFPPTNGLPVMPTPNIVNNNSLFMGQNNPTLPPSNDMVQNNMFPSMMHTPPFSSLYGNMLPQSPTPPNVQNLAEQWYYEDPKKIIQGPFSSKEMFSWYRAGFFSPSLMVRRACDAHMRPLGSYGPVVPFAQLDVMSPFPLGGFESRSQTHDMLNQRPALGLEDSLWGQPGPSQDLMWMQSMNTRNEARVNNLPMFFWDSQPASTITSKSLLPEDITKEMKTEDQILAQLRASQSIPTSTFLSETTTTTTFTSTSTKESFPTVNATPDLEKLQELMPVKMTPAVETQKESNEVETKTGVEKPVKEQNVVETKPQTQKAPSEPKVKPNKEVEKQKTKEKGTKSKKKKEEEKEEVVEVKKEEEVKVEKASVESSPVKNKKEEKQSKKEMEKEKKEWIKDGFTIVKGPEKNNSKESKENKKKVEEAKAAEEAERKKKEEEKVVEEEKKKKVVEAIKKQQDLQQRQLVESLVKRAPWSASQLGATNKDGLTLAEIQRLEKEKKVEQMKEQQQMMHIIAQKQAEALAAEQVVQEMQQNAAWSKSKKLLNTSNNIGPSIAAIQAETRRLSAALQPMEEPPQPQPQPPAHAPWSNTQNGGFWDTQPGSSKLDSPQEPKVEKNKKPTINITPKKETSPVAEFEDWCASVLVSWSSQIDVPTFVGFLKDIESPYEVKDYVKCYLGESKETGDFARQFLERRSKLLRVGTVTPSDDLCSPAIAVNPRPSLSEYQEVKGKGKKSKKNKMLKVDARILGFSVTASEDRINVGDIDTV